MKSRLHEYCLEWTYYEFLTTRVIVQYGMVNGTMSMVFRYSYVRVPSNYNGLRKNLRTAGTSLIIFCSVSLLSIRHVRFECAPVNR